MIKNNNSIELEIVTVRDGIEKVVSFTYNKREEKERPMALDVLMQAQSKTIPDLAFRFGCRARNCGVCTIDINGRPRVACRARVKDGDKLSAIAMQKATIGKSINWQINPTKKSFGYFNILVKSLIERPSPSPSIIIAKTSGAIFVTISIAIIVQVSVNYFDKK